MTPIHSLSKRSKVLAWDGALYAAPLAADNVLRVFEGASGQWVVGAEGKVGCQRFIDTAIIMVFELCFLWKTIECMPMQAL